MSYLLQRGGLCVAQEAVSRAPVPVLMVSDTALALIRDVLDQPNLFADKHRITRRVVRWGAEPVSMPHGAVVVSEQDFAAIFAPAPISRNLPTLAHVYAAPPFPTEPMLQFGQLCAIAARVELTPEADRAAVHVEAVPRGWLFLIPSGPSAAWLLGVGGPIERLLEDSQLIAPQIAALGACSPPFETAPRQLPLLAGQNQAGENWLACGTAAIGYDPICGDGSATAVREAILGAAVLRALSQAGDPQALTTHYHSMLTASLRRHIQISGQFYATGGDTPWWREQVVALAQGYQWTTQQLAHLPEPRYLLRGFDLIEKVPAA
jgi:2-polyprenyl-6-methoxyphenol hydroxylase-like FAD-dependent oxidoreductase